MSDLESVCDRRDQYRKAANLVEAVHQLMEYFQQYEAIPKVRGGAGGSRGSEWGRQQQEADKGGGIMDASPNSTEPNARGGGGGCWRGWDWEQQADKGGERRGLLEGLGG